MHHYTDTYSHTNGQMIGHLSMKLNTAGFKTDIQGLNCHQLRDLWIFQGIQSCTRNP